MAGNEENISGRSMYREENITTSETVILIAIHTSNIAVGSGKSKIARIAVIETGITRCFHPTIPAFAGGALRETPLPLGARRDVFAAADCISYPSTS